MIRRCLLTVWFAVAIAAPAQVLADRGSISQIVAALKSQDYEGALLAAKAAEQRAPRDPRLWTLEGIAFSGKKDDSLALAAYRHALELAPDYGPALKAEARLLYQSQDKQVDTVLRKLIRMDPSDHTAHEMLAVSEARQNACKSALQEFEYAKDAVDSHADSLQWFGYCLMQEKQFAQATAAFSRLMELAPNELAPRYNLALVQTLAHREADAVQTMQPLITVKAPDIDVLSLASEAYEAMGDTPKAVELLQQALRLDSQNPDLYVRFAGLCLSHNSLDAGLNIVQAGIERIPNDASLYITRGLLYGQLGRYSDAEQDLRTAEKLNPDQTSSSFALAATSVQHGDLDEGLRTVRRQLESHPDDPALHYMLAKILVTQGARPGSPAFDEALRSAMTTVRLKPDYPAGHDLLASLYLDAGNNDLTAAQSRMALSLDSSDQTALYHLIAALRSSGNKAEVQDLVKRLLSLQSKGSEQAAGHKGYKIMQQAPGEVERVDAP
jgi:Flp pilus assembly protein TadD